MPVGMRWEAAPAGAAVAAAMQQGEAVMCDEERVTREESSTH
jgi:hypothetical protein